MAQPYVGGKVRTSDYFVGFLLLVLVIPVIASPVERDDEETNGMQKVDSEDSRHSEKAPGVRRRPTAIPIDVEEDYSEEYDNGDKDDGNTRTTGRYVGPFEEEMDEDEEERVAEKEEAEEEHKSDEEEEEDIAQMAAAGPGKVKDADTSDDEQRIDSDKKPDEDKEDDIGPPPPTDGPPPGDDDKQGEDGTSDTDNDYKSQIEEVPKPQLHEPSGASRVCRVRLLTLCVGMVGFLFFLVGYHLLSIS